MADRGDPAYLRPCTPSDDTFLAAVFATTWADQVAALPNQNLAQHVLRIQHIAHEQRLASRYPGHERHLVVWEGEPAGRLYLHRTEHAVQVVDLTLLPAFRGRSIAARIVRDLCARAALDDDRVLLLVARRDPRLAEMVRGLGFHPTGEDDLETLFEWPPARPS